MSEVTIYDVLLNIIKDLNTTYKGKTIDNETMESIVKYAQNIINNTYTITKSDYGELIGIRFNPHTFTLTFVNRYVTIAYYSNKNDEVISFYIDTNLYNKYRLFNIGVDGEILPIKEYDKKYNFQNNSESYTMYEDTVYMVASKNDTYAYLVDTNLKTQIVEVKDLGKVYEYEFGIMNAIFTFLDLSYHRTKFCTRYLWLIEPLYEIVEKIRKK